VIEAGDRLVPTARPAHSAYVKRHLERRGVKLRLGAPAARVEAHGVGLKDGTWIDAFTMIWTAGVIPPPVVQDLPVLHERDGRVRGDEWLRALDADAPRIESVYVIGDGAASLRGDGKLQPALSQTAIARGVHVGAQLVGGEKGRKPPPFQFHDVG